jgi:hypothetical protein
MRYTEFNLTEDELFELNMSPTNLQKMVKGIDARAGMEFELIVPGAEGGDDGDMEPDYDQDEMCRSIEDAVQFFHDGDYNGRRDVERLRERMQNDFYEWLNDKVYQDWQHNGEEYLEEWIPNNVDESEWNPEGLEGDERQEALEEFIANMHSDPGDGDAFDEFREEIQGSYDESDWLDDEDLDRMSRIEDAYDISWPYWSSTGGETSIDDIADDFSRAIGRPVNAASNYHGARREAGHYVVEPDGSLSGEAGETGLEFVSPVLTVPEMLEDIDKVTDWANRVGAYTNNTTGLHMNVSVPDQKNLDYVKLAMFLGDNYILEQFGREGNSYCKSALNKIKQQAKSNPDRVEEMMRQFQSGLNQLASKMIHTGSTEKFTSINNRGDWIEFRSPGGNWLDGPADIKRVKDTLLRTVVALDVATKPDQFKQEYYKKLYKTLTPKGDDNSIQYFAKYAAGELPKSAMMSFVRQIQQKRAAGKKGPVEEFDVPFVWKVVGSPDSPYQSQGTEVVATSERRALEAAVKKWNLNIYPKSVEEFTQGWRATPIRPASDAESHPEGRGRPHDPNGRYAIVSREDPAAHGRTGGPAPDYKFRFNLQDLEQQGHGRYVLQAWAARNNVDSADYMVVDTTQYADQPVAGSTLDLQRQRLAAQMPALDTADGNWEIYSIASNNTVYRFTADTEEQAVQAFRIWQDAIRNPGLPREGFNLRTTPGAAPRTQQQQMYEVTYTVNDGAQTSMNSVRTLATNANAAMDQVRNNLQRQGQRVESIDAEPVSGAAPARGSDSLPPGNARWRILDRNDQEVYSFINTTAQSDANQYARNWMINTAPAEIRNRGPFNIVPVT